MYNMKKIINLFLVLFAGLILVSLGTPEVFAEENDFEFNITVVKGETIVKLHPLSGDFGTRISFDAKGLEVDEFEFAYHILNGEVIEASSYDVLASKSTNLIVVLEEQGEPVTTYIDTNGELLGAFISSEDQPASQPTKPGFDFRGYVQVEDTEKPVFVAKYSRFEDKPITVTVNGGSKDPEVVTYNDVVTLTPDSENFSYWADEDGQVVSRNANYRFSALQEVELTAVFEQSESDAPVVYLSNVTGISPHNQSFLGYIEGDFVEYGLLASKEAEVLTLGLEGVVEMPSQALNPLTNEFLRSIPEELEYKSFRAYAKLANGDVVYSDNNFVVMPSSGGQSFTETFDTHDIGTGYIDTNFTGLGGTAWAIGHSRNEGDYAIDGTGIMLRRASDSYIQITFSNGLSAFSFDYTKAFTGGSDRILEVKINDAVVFTSENFGGSTIVYQTSLTDLEYTGNVVVIIKLQGATTTNRQTTIDNISWTEAGVEGASWTKLYIANFINDGEISDVVVQANSFLEKPEDPSKEGHIFEGWFTDPIEGELFDFGNTPIILCFFEN